MATLNKLQGRTLALLQELAEDVTDDDHDTATGEVTVHVNTHAHGNHMHVGRFVVSTKFASGLGNENVWKALERKGYARSGWPLMITLTKAGLEHRTGIREKMLEESDH